MHWHRLLQLSHSFIIRKRFSTEQNSLLRSLNDVSLICIYFFVFFFLCSYISCDTTQIRFYILYYLFLKASWTWRFTRSKRTKRSFWNNWFAWYNGAKRISWATRTWRPTWWKRYPRYWIVRPKRGRWNTRVSKNSKCIQNK